MARVELIILKVSQYVTRSLSRCVRGARLDLRLVCVLLWLWRENGNQFGGGHHLFDSPLPASTCVIDEAAGKRCTWNKVFCME